MRGKGSVLYIAALGIGITPAYAGKRRRKAPCRATGRDHPRVCGEKMNFATHELASGGSPPRVRGKVDFHLRYNVLQGITPACAGKREEAERKPIPGWDHPRVCGEKDGSDLVLIDEKGSPPRVRGKEKLHGAHGQLWGITPACAGKRRSSTLGYAASGDHPRVCGEKRHLHHLQRLPLGSPPRVRGKVLFPSFLHRLYGITPACAGKS